MPNLAASITVRVPGSTSNCGAGFDTLGLALQIYNRISISTREGGAATPQTPDDSRAQSMVDDTAADFFRKTGRAPRGFSYHITGDVPAARGLGSSVTVIAGVLAGLNVLHDGKLGRDDLVQMATALEGHPDNASAGILGGFCVARCEPATGRYLSTVRFSVPANVVFVVVSPQIELLTKESRGALPPVLPFFDAVRSINSAAYFVAAMASGDYARLRDAGGDFMHEPYRLPKIPGAQAALEAGRAAGAFTGWLSGSGSSVLCMTASAEAVRVGAAMSEAFAAVGVVSEVRLLSADNDGLRLE
jgi:homoserine kinase